MAVTAYAQSWRQHGGIARIGASDHAHNWVRLHAAAIDRSFVERQRTAPPVAPAERATKRLFDLVLVFVLLAVLSPIMLLIAFLARQDGGPAIFGHRRIGANGEPFTCWKFRTMVVNADQVLARVLAADPAAREEWEKCFKLKRDPRVTAIGQFLRVTSLDELPQLFNVLKGEMSLVGPRPIVRDEIKRYGAAFHDYARCRPGVTGIWQVSGRSNVDYGARVRLDQNYARHWSLATDIGVLLRTAIVVVQRSGAY